MVEDSSSSHEMRIARLSRRDEVPSGDNGHGYSNFVRIMRITLPMAALVVIVVLFIGSGSIDNVVTPVTPYANDLTKEEIVQNELLNPKFESMDKKSQPYIITADKAVQGSKNKDLIMLDRPKGSMTMKNGSVVNMHSQTGAYRQDTERFFLQGGVYLKHVEGYTLESEEAHIDLKEKFVWSERKVKGRGPDIEVDAAGMHANGKTGEIVFVGPARLVLTKGLEGL